MFIKCIPLTLVVATSFINSCVTTSIKVHIPASKNTTFPRLRMFDTLPALREFTLCSWVKSYHLTAECSAIMSYASVKFDNEIVVMLCKGNQNIAFTLWRGKDHITIGCNYKWKMSSWFHVCVNWFGYADVANAFVNGQKCQEVIFISEDIVPSGGVLVVGQEQDAFDSKFEHNAAFSGDISDYHMWDERLTESQIKEIAECRGKNIEGNIISWMKTPMVPVDGVIISQTTLCARRGRVTKTYAKSDGFDWPDLE